MGIVLRWCGRLGGRRVLRVSHELASIDLWLRSLWLGLCFLKGIEDPVSRLMNFKRQRWLRFNVRDNHPYVGLYVLLCLGFMNCMIWARRAFSVSSSSGSIAAAFLFSETGTVGVETRITWFAIRVRCGLGSRHSGGEIAS